MRLSPQIAETIQNSLDTLQVKTAGTMEGELQLSFERYDSEANTVSFLAQTTPRMQNIGGVLHGGACALLLDEAMGCTANSLRSSDTIAPTSQMQLNYHRPVQPGEKVRIRVRIVSATRHLIHTSAELAMASDPERVCVSASATYYSK